MPVILNDTHYPAGSASQARNARPYGGHPPPIDSRGIDSDGRGRDAHQAANRAGGWPDLQTLQRIRYTVEELALANELSANGVGGPGVTAADLLRVGMSRMLELKGQVAVNAEWAGYSINDAAGADEGELLRLASEVKTAIQGASAASLVALGAAELKKLRDHCAAASSRGTAANVRSPADEFAGYSINSHLDR